MNASLYDRIGVGYAKHRQPDARIAKQIMAALGPSRSILNVGAGTGSYEPSDRRVVAIEPSAEMLKQRIPSAAPAIQARADYLPLGDRSVDATLAILTGSARRNTWMPPSVARSRRLRSSPMWSPGSSAWTAISPMVPGDACMETC